MKCRGIQIILPWDLQAFRPDGFTIIYYLLFHSISVFKLKSLATNLPFLRPCPFSKVQPFGVENTPIHNSFQCNDLAAN